MTLDLEPPDELLASYASTAPPGRALDLGAGRGETALWLVRHGFTVDAVESDPPALRVLAARLAGTAACARFIDIRRYPLARRAYSLVTALAFLHFFHSEELPLLARRLLRCLAPGGILLASVLTTDDPGLEARRARGVSEVAPATFRLDDGRGLIHYFARGELGDLFHGLQVLHYEEARRLGPAGELRAGATLAARKA